MTNRLSRTDFVNSLENTRIDVNDAQGDLKAQLQRADLDGSGDVAGAAEAQRLFTELDRFDNDGSASSIRTHNGTAPTKAGVLADQARQIAKPNLRRGLSRADQSAALSGKQVALDALPDDVRAQVRGADKNGDGRIAGHGERAEAWRRVDALDNDGDPGSVVATDGDGNETAAGRAARALRESATPDPDAAALNESVVSWRPDARAMERARTSGLGQTALTEVPRHAETYRQAAEMTGVPPQLIAAIHGNESQFGTYRSSTRGPESGYGLDDRFVSTRWANGKLAEHGLGPWERGQDTANGRLQSAVVAAEHLKRVAGYAGIEVGPNMSESDIAGAATAYTTGIRAAQRASERGTSWMFNPSDVNPHPLHPGGTSRTSRGTVRVDAERKEGLLRWDTLLPLIEEAMQPAGVS